MYETLHCIALRTVRYSDTRSIVSAWSAERGFVSFAMPSGNGREANRRRALTMPLSTFEGICDVRPGRDVLFIRDIRPMRIGLSTVSDPAKLAMALFLAEVFERVLRNSQPDKALSLLIFDTAVALDRADARAVANFHLWTLYRLTIPLGIEPDMTSWAQGSLFDPIDGRWLRTMTENKGALLPDEAEVVRLLSRMDRENIGKIRISRENRNKILDGILAYYDMHYCKITPLNSLDVVRDLF